MSYIITILILLLLLLLVLYYLVREESRKSAKVHRSLVRGIDYALSNDFDKAIEEMLKVVNRYRELAEPYISLGNLYRAKGELENAIQIHEKVAANNRVPDSLRREAQYFLGVDYSRAGFYDRAVNIFRELSEKSGEDIRPLIELEKIYVELGDWEKAIEIRLKLMNLEKDSESLVKSGNLLAHYITEKSKELIASGKLDEAEDILKRALERAPNLVDTVLTYSDLLYRKGDYDALLPLFDGILDTAFDYHFLILDSMERIFSGSGEYEKYGELLEKKINSGNYSPQIYVAYCKFLRKKGEKEKASRMLKEFVSKFPYQVEAIQLLADILLEMGEEEEALEYYRKLSRLGLNDPRPFVCTSCGYRMEEMSWRCPKCGMWDSVKYMPVRAGS